MGIKLSKFVNVTKSKYFWLYIVFGFLIAVASVILMPLWKNNNIDVFFADWGFSVLNIVIAFVVILYLALFLSKKLTENTNNVIKTLTVIEFLVFVLIALGLILSQFNVIPINEPSQILGLALWIRGAIEIFVAYYYDKSTGKKYSVFRLVIALALVSVAVFLMVKNTITRTLILWVITITLLVCSLFAIVLGFIKKPKKVKKSKAENVKADNKEEK